MKPEPLIVKRFETTGEFIKPDGKEMKIDETVGFYFEKDVKAAVEWLKAEVKKSNIYYRDAFRLIDEAFHDVTQDTDADQP